MNRVDRTSKEKENDFFSALQFEISLVGQWIEPTERVMKKKLKKILPSNLMDSLVGPWIESTERVKKKKMKFFSALLQFEISLVGQWIEPTERVMKKKLKKILPSNLMDSLVGRHIIAQSRLYEHQW